jgi:hypothetical protein
MSMTQLEILQKQLIIAQARKTQDDADSLLKADRNQTEIDKIQGQIAALPSA